jgi:hypothetical protein
MWSLSRVLTVRGKHVKTLTSLALLTLGASFFMVSGFGAPAQVGINVGEPPICPYGYYEVAPYNCAPDGYYGPEWYSGGVFIGAGPWFHGANRFYGHVDHHLDYRKGYRGALPARGEHVAERRAEFHGQAMHDQHGHEAPRGRR